MNPKDSFYVTDLTGKLYMPQPDTFSEQAVLFAHPPHTYLIERSFQLYTRWNIAKYIQNATFTSSIVSFLDVLKDFEIITLEDGFGVSELSKLEQKFIRSVHEEQKVDLTFFVELAMYEDYYHNINEILFSPPESKWPFPDKKLRKSLCRKLASFIEANNTLLCPFYKWLHGKNKFSTSPLKVSQVHPNYLWLYDNTYLFVAFSSEVVSLHELWFRSLKEFSKGKETLDKLLVFMPYQKTIALLNSM